MNKRQKKKRIKKNLEKLIQQTISSNVPNNKNRKVFLSKLIEDQMILDVMIEREITNE